MTTRAFIPAARFALLSPAYDLLCRWIGLGERFRRFELELLAADSPKKVLEVGCGSGELLRRLGLVVAYRARPDPRHFGSIT